MATRFLRVHSPAWISRELPHQVRAYDSEAGTLVPIADVWARPGQVLEVQEELARHFQFHAEPVEAPVMKPTPARQEPAEKPEPVALPPLRTTQAPLPTQIRQPRRGRKGQSDA